MAYEADGQHAIRDFPAEFLDDDMLMRFADELFRPDVRGDNWHGVHDALEDYIWQEYELVLDDYFDWEDYGEWYDATH